VRFAGLYSHRQGIRVNWRQSHLRHRLGPVQSNGKNKRNFLYGQGNLIGIAYAEI
jgi:hypothetical protein